MDRIVFNTEMDIMSIMAMLKVCISDDTRRKFNESVFRKYGALTGTGEGGKKVGYVSIEVEKALIAQTNMIDEEITKSKKPTLDLESASHQGGK